MLVNSSLILYCEATGAGNLTYQWRKDRELLPNQNNGDYLIDTVNFKDAGSYFCEVIDGRGKVAISLPATVTVHGTYVKSCSCVYIGTYTRYAGLLFQILCLSKM